jgi:serine protease Do
MVTEVRPGSPAAQGGLKTGDVIVQYQGHEIHQPQDLSRRVAASPPGTKAKLDVVNGGARRTIEVTVGELKDERPTAPSAPKGR